MVSYPAYRRWRITVALLSTLNLIATATYYGRWASLLSQENPAPTLYWGDWSEIVVSVVFFFTYWYSVFGKGGLLHRFIRAFLLFAPSILLLYLTLGQIHYELQDSRLGTGYQPFSCEGYILCILFWVDIFMSIFLGFFVIFDVGITLKLGPCNPNDAASGLQQNHPSVVVVSPQQGYYVPPQQYYAPQPGQMQQQQYYALQPGQLQQQYYQPQMQMQHESSFKIDQNEQPPQSPVYMQYSSQASPLPQHFQT